MTTYKDLVVWNKAIEFVSSVYEITGNFPKHEQYGLVSQIRRAAVSIPSNIAEGYCRAHRREYIQFLRIAFGSGGELETHLIISERLGFLQKNRHNELRSSLSEIMKMLNGLMQALVAKP